MPVLPQRVDTLAAALPVCCFCVMCLQLTDPANYSTLAAGNSQLPTLTVTLSDPRDEALHYTFFARREVSATAVRVLGVFEHHLPDTVNCQPLATARAVMQGYGQDVIQVVPTDNDDAYVRERLLAPHLEAGLHTVSSGPVQVCCHYRLQAPVGN